MRTIPEPMERPPGYSGVFVYGPYMYPPMMQDLSRNRSVEYLPGPAAVLPGYRLDFRSQTETENAYGVALEFPIGPGQVYPKKIGDDTDLTTPAGPGLHGRIWWVRNLSCRTLSNSHFLLGRSREKVTVHAMWSDEVEPLLAFIHMPNFTRMPNPTTPAEMEEWVHQPPSMVYGGHVERGLCAAGFTYSHEALREYARALVRACEAANERVATRSRLRVQQLEEKLEGEPQAGDNNGAG